MYLCRGLQSRHCWKGGPPSVEGPLQWAQPRCVTDMWAVLARPVQGNLLPGPESSQEFSGLKPGLKKNKIKISEQFVGQWSKKKKEQESHEWKCFSAVITRAAFKSTAKNSLNLTFLNSNLQASFVFYQERMHFVYRLSKEGVLTQFFLHIFFHIAGSLAMTLPQVSVCHCWEISL